jgi:hypothetical protein
MHAPFPAPRSEDMSSSASRGNLSLSSRSSPTMRPHPPTPVFASHTRSATVAGRSSTASQAAIGARRRSSSSADRNRPAGSSPTGTGPSMSVPSGTKCRAWSAARSTPKAKSCPGNPAGVQSAVAQARLLFVAVDARRRQGFLPCRDPSHACPIQPPLSYRARNNYRPHHRHNLWKPRTSDT